MTAVLPDAFAQACIESRSSVVLQHVSQWLACQTVTRVNEEAPGILRANRSECRAHRFYQGLSGSLAPVLPKRFLIFENASSIGLYSGE